MAAGGNFFGAMSWIWVSLGLMPLTIVAFLWFTAWADRNLVLGEAERRGLGRESSSERADAA